MTNKLLAEMMSQEDFLEHYGVKGMKWGVLRDQAAAGNKGAQKKLAKADVKWEKELNSTAGWVKINNAVADKANGPNGYIEKFNASPKYKDIKDFSDFDDPKVQSYFNDFEKLATKKWNETLVEQYGESPSGRYKVQAVKGDDGQTRMDVVDTQSVSHAAVAKTMQFHFIFGPNGVPVGIKPLSENGELEHSIFGDDMTHTTSMLTEEEFLEHFGVKGMKWGKRKAEGPKLGPDGNPQKTRKELRALDRASAKKDASARDSEIDAARGRLASGENRKNYLDAKAKYKADKKVIGKREAKKAFDAVKAKNIEDYNTSQEAKSGRESVVAAVTGLAAIALLAYANS